MMDAYMTEYLIFRQPAKPKYKPDNRIAVNFAKYIVDTMNGFFHWCSCQIASVMMKRFQNMWSFLISNRYTYSELSKICSIYGKGYEMYYVDQDGRIGITYLDPQEAFMIYDDSVLERPSTLYGPIWIQKMSFMAVYQMKKE